MPNGTPVFLIDSYAQIYRGYHAVRNLSTAAGVPTNAVFAMTNFLLRLHRDFPSENGAFVFDKGKPPRRLAILPEYKANRPPMPEDLRTQIPVIRELVQAFGWPLVEQEGIEADDLMASIAVTLNDHPVKIFSADKDLAQIIDERVEMMVPDPSGAIKKRGVSEVLEKFGIPPNKIVDYLAFLGDSADNIPGVPGVGTKTAAELLNQFESGEAVFEHLDAVKKESLRSKLASSRERFEQNRKLILLDTTPPQGISWDVRNLERKQPDFAAIRKICSEMELKSILKELDKLDGREPEIPEDDLFSGLTEKIRTEQKTIRENEKKKNGMTQLELF